MKTHKYPLANKHLFFFFSFSPFCLAPIPMTCNSECKYAGLQHSAKLYCSCIWGITALVLISWKLLSQTCPVPPNNITYNVFLLCRGKICWKIPNCLVNFHRKLHKYFSPSRVLHPKHPMTTEVKKLPFMSPSYFQIIHNNKFKGILPS